MLAKLWRYASYRNFSNSAIWRNLEKKPPEPSSPTSTSSQGYQLARMPTNFEKKILIYSGRFKTIEEIPKLITSEMLDRAKTKIRIKIANLMILVTVISCGTIIYNGKVRRREKIRKWEEANEAEKKELQQKEAAQGH